MAETELIVVRVVQLPDRTSVLAVMPRFSLEPGEMGTAAGLLLQAAFDVGVGLREGLASAGGAEAVMAFDLALADAMKNTPNTVGSQRVRVAKTKGADGNG